MAEPIVLIISVDAEEDNWVPTRDRLTVENIRELPRLEKLLGEFGARATYFVTHQVATTDWAAEILRETLSNGRAEVGAHLHPWNTPPISSQLTLPSTMLTNLSGAEQRSKIDTLTESLKAAIGTRPTSFRAGRWSFDSGVAKAILSFGYRVDSSVTPFRSWSRDYGPSHVGAPLDVYRIDPQMDHRKPASDGPLVEVPVSWGYSQKNWQAAERLHVSLESSPLRNLHLLRLAERLHLVNNAVLSPEIEPVSSMVTLVRRLLDRGVKLLHLTFHSVTLRAGLGPFAATQRDVERFYTSLADIIEKISAITSVRFATVGAAADLLAPTMRVPETTG